MVGGLRGNYAVRIRFAGGCPGTRVCDDERMRNAYHESLGQISCLGIELKGQTMIHRLLHNAFMRLIRLNLPIGARTIQLAEALEDRCTTDCASN